MKPPKKVQVGPYRIEIVQNEVLLSVLYGEDSEKAVGLCDVEKGRIVLSSKLCDDVLAETVLHEVLHAINYATGVANDLDDETEEKVVSRTATVLLDVLRRNPALVRYLTT